jgi:hypothetical protein
MYERVYGEKYQKGLDIAEIAKLVRKDIRAAIKSGNLPEIRTSVRISRYSGGQSLNVEIKGVPDGFVIHNPEWVRFSLENPHIVPRIPRYSEKSRDVEKTLERIVSAYNHDGSETMIDYFDVNFYAHVGWSYELEAEDKAGIQIALESEARSEAC